MVDRIFNTLDKYFCNINPKIYGTSSNKFINLIYQFSKGPIICYHPMIPEIIYWHFTRGTFCAYQIYK